MKYADEVNVLRKKFPVGITQAEKLLEQAGGNVAQAESLLKQHLLAVFMQKLGVGEGQAHQYLEKAGYDMGVAIKMLEEDTYTVTELCLLKNKRKEEALSKVLYAISEKYNCDFWLCWEKDCPGIHPKEYPFVVLMEWMGYEAWEGYLVLDSTVGQACRTVSLPWLAAMLSHAIARSREVDSICEDEAYTSLYDTYLMRQDELVAVLYEYVKENIAVFP